MRRRHWKQVYDFDAELVFTKRMVLRKYGIEIAQPGDVVPQALKDSLGRHKLRIWWEGGFIAIQEKKVEKVEAPEPTPSAPEDTVKHIGGGHYEVTRGGVTVRVKGKENIPEDLR